MVFSNPILDIKKINSLYKQSQFTYAAMTNYLKKTYGRYLKQILPKRVKDLTLLDIGCGNGFFLEEAKKLGVNNVWGVEPSAQAVKSADKFIRQRIKIDILRAGLFERDTFDIISCFHTLDHVSSPNDFLKITYNLLKEGGQILFITHDSLGLSVKLFGEGSPIFDLEHIFLFNKKTLAKVFVQNGFNKVKVFDIKNNYPLIYWLNIVPIPKFAKDILGKLLNFSKIGNTAVDLKVGNIAIVATK